MRITFGDVAGITRLPFLALTPLCVAVGASVSWWKTGSLDWMRMVLALAGGVAAHVSVNALNEYQDFRSGLDLHTEKTPFSGGSGTLPNRPELASLALRIGIGGLVVTALVGFWFVLQAGPGILLVGMPGLLLVAAYTPWVLRNPYLTLIASGLGFGPAMVMGTEYALTGSYSWSGACAALVVFFLVNNLLLVNQFPDIEPDRFIGRKNIPITWGRERAIRLMGLFFLLAYASLACGILTASMPVAAMTGFLTVPLAFVIFRKMREHHADIARLVPVMGMNVVLVLLTPALIVGGYLLSAFMGGGHLMG